jgi:hypothetical protein
MVYKKITQKIIYLHNQKSLCSQSALGLEVWACDVPKKGFTVSALYRTAPLRYDIDVMRYRKSTGQLYVCDKAACRS